VTAARLAAPRASGIYVKRACLAHTSRLLRLSKMRNQIKCKALVKWRLDRVVEYIEANLTRPIYLEDLGKVAGVSRMHFAIQFRAATGSSPHQYLLSRKIAYGQRLLLNPLTSIVDASILSGFSSQAHFTLVFKRLVGDPPGRWRARMQSYSKRGWLPNVTQKLVNPPMKSQAGGRHNGVILIISD